MKNLLLIILLALLIACGTEPSMQEDSEYPIRIGTWQINSPSQADWIGVNATQKIKTAQRDTIVFDSPSGNSMTMSYITFTGAEGKKQDNTLLTYIDSTLNKRISWNEVDIMATRLEFPGKAVKDEQGNEVFTGFLANVTDRSVGPNRMKLTINIQYECWADIKALNLLRAVFFKKDSTEIVQYHFKTNGFIPAIRTLNGCD